MSDLKKEDKMSNNMNHTENNENFWSEQNKSAFQKNLNDIFMINPHYEQKILKESLALQSLAIIGAFLIQALVKDSSMLNKNLLFIAACSSATLAYIRAARKKAVLKETLAAVGIFSFFGDRTSKTNNIQEKMAIINQSNPILSPNYSSVYRQSKVAALLSGVALTGGYYFDKVGLEPALLAGVAILSACNIYDWMIAKNSVKRIQRALPKGVKLPCIENQRG